MFAGNNDLQVYKDFFAWMGKPELFKMRKNRILEYADIAPLAYLHIALEGGTKNYVKHLLVDEMQDYSPIQYKVMQKLFPCRKTVLGDTSQSVNPYGSSTADMIQKALIMGEIMKLCKATVLLVKSQSLHSKYGQIPNLNLSHGMERNRKYYNSIMRKKSCLPLKFNSYSSGIRLQITWDYLQNRIASL